MTTVAVVAMGEMGSGIAQRLADRGARVLTSLAGRSAASAARAREAGAEPVTDEALIAEAEILLSVVPPSVALETAERFLPLIAATARKPLYIDCNAIAPQTLHLVAERFLARDLPFLDASIIGSPPGRDGSGPRLYLSGPHAEDAAPLRSLGLDTHILSSALGDASALKMAYAGITKGFQALGTAMVLGAARNGALEALTAELGDSQPQLHAWLVRLLPKMPAKAYRWDAEMREIARFLEPEAGAAKMLAGAADLYAHVAEDHRAGPASEIISTLQSFVDRPAES